MRASQWPGPGPQSQQRLTGAFLLRQQLATSCGESDLRAGSREGEDPALHGAWPKQIRNLPSLQPRIGCPLNSKEQSSVQAENSWVDGVPSHRRLSLEDSRRGHLFPMSVFSVLSVPTDAVVQLVDTWFLHSGSRPGVPHLSVCQDRPHSTHSHQIQEPKQGRLSLSSQNMKEKEKNLGQPSLHKGRALYV